MGRIRNLTISYASVTATLALVLALGMGGAYAATKIGSKDVEKGAVKSKHVKDDSLRGKDLRETSLGEVPRAAHAATTDRADHADAADRALRAEVADSATQADQAATAGTASAVAPNAVNGTGVLDGSLTGADIDETTLGAPLAGYQYVIASSAYNSSSPKFATPECPPGKRYVFGGYGIESGTSGSPPNEIGDVVIKEFSPNADGRRIITRAYETNPHAGNWALHASAICVDAA